MGKRQVVITTDSHIGRPETDFSGYIDPPYRDQYVEQLDAAQEMMKLISSDEGSNPLMTNMGGGTFMDSTAVKAQQARRRAKIEEIGVEGFRDEEFMMIVGDSDHDLRLKELEADGTTAAVLFPQGGAFGLGGRPADDDFYWNGIRAHNRWLAEFVFNAPERWAGTIQADLADIDRTVAEVKWGQENGLRGGLFQSGNCPDALPSFHSPHYDALWSVLEETGLPFVMHAAFPNAALEAVFDPERGGLPFMKLGGYDDMNKGGPLSHFIFGKVFERHPALKVVIAETGGSEWILRAMGVYDGIYAADPDGPGPRIKPVEPIWGNQTAGLQSLPHRPSEYLGTNVWVQTHCHHADWAALDQVGPQNVVWGSDFPHAESTWPNSIEYLMEIKAKFGISTTDLEAVLAHNPAKLFGFDLEALQPVADRVGPEFD
jgi:predicted TIM-barrel fold metal-dependent hydrolase